MDKKACHIAEFTMSQVLYAIEVMERKLHVPKVKCPVRGCESLIDERYLTCWTHHEAIPRDLRKALMIAYRGGQTLETASDEYLDLALQAISQVNGGGL